MLFLSCLLRLFPLLRSVARRSPLSLIFLPFPKICRSDANKIGGLHQPSQSSVPIALIFGTEDAPVKHVISGDQLRKLPAATVTKLLAIGNTIGGDGVSVHQMGGTPWCDALVRVQQYLSHGSYVPFSPHAPLYVIDAAKNAIKWTASSGAEAGAGKANGKATTADPSAAAAATTTTLRTSSATYGLFLKELELYHFAKAFDYASLREHSAAKLRTGYPISARETMALLERLYRTVVEAKDEQSVEFVKACFKKHRDAVLRLPGYMDLLRRSASRDPLVQILLEAQVASLREADAERILSEIPMKKEEVTTPTTTPIAATGVSSIALANVPDLLPAVHPLLHLYESLKSESLVVAVQDGYGTLLPDGASAGANGFARNRDFKFVRSELLAVDYSRAALNGRQNVTVENSRGQRGDILATLVRVVPFGLGVTDEVNCGAGGGGDGLPPQTAVFLDREARLYSAVAGPGAKSRSRSRSPSRV